MPPHSPDPAHGAGDLKFFSQLPTLQQEPAIFPASLLHFSSISRMSFMG